MYQTVFWTVWEKERVERSERIALKHIYYHIWKRSPVQVRCMRQCAQGWCTGMTQRDGMEREVGEGFRIGNTSTSQALCQVFCTLNLVYLHKKKGSQERYCYFHLLGEKSKVQTRATWRPVLLALSRGDGSLGLKLSHFEIHTLYLFSGFPQRCFQEIKQAFHCLYLTASARTQP